jgi:hypothetical protein
LPTLLIALVGSGGGEDDGDCGIEDGDGAEEGCPFSWIACDVSFAFGRKKILVTGGSIEVPAIACPRSRRRASHVPQLTGCLAAIRILSDWSGPISNWLASYVE